MKQKENGGDPSSPTLRVPKFYNLIETYPRIHSLLEGLKKVEFYTSVKQKRDGFIMISDLLKEIDGRTVLNDSLIDYLLSHQEEIPKIFKEHEGFMVFLGHTYRAPFAPRCARSLYQTSPGRWKESEIDISGKIFKDVSIALLKTI